MDIQTAAGSLLLLRLLSDAFVIRVLWLQIPRLNAPNEPEYKPLRWVFLALAVSIFIGNMVPIGIDIATLFVPVDRTQQLSDVSIAYAFSNAATAALFAILLWLVYVVTNMIVSRLKRENAALQTDNDEMHTAHDK